MPGLISTLESLCQRRPAHLLEYRMQRNGRDRTLVDALFGLEDDRQTRLHQIADAFGKLAPCDDTFGCDVVHALDIRSDQAQYGINQILDIQKRTLLGAVPPHLERLFAVARTHHEPRNHVPLLGERIARTVGSDRTDDE